MPISRGVILVSFDVRPFVFHSADKFIPIRRTFGRREEASADSLPLSHLGLKSSQPLRVPRIDTKSICIVHRSLKSHARCTQNVPQLNSNDILWLDKLVYAEIYCPPNHHYLQARNIFAVLILFTTVSATWIIFGSWSRNNSCRSCVGNHTLSLSLSPYLSFCSVIS